LKLATLWDSVQRAPILDNGSSATWVRAFNAFEVEIKQLCGQVLRGKGKSR
jgi:hypothetical protein